MTTIDFDKKLVCGPEFVAVRIVDNCEDLKVGSIWLPPLFFLRLDKKLKNSIPIQASFRYLM